MFLRLLLVLYLAGAANLLAGARRVKDYPHNARHRQSVSRKWSQTATEDAEPVCDTEPCQNIGKIFKENMNESADPCEDFYAYACGNWGKNNPTPKGERSWSFLRKLQKTVSIRAYEFLKDIDNADLLPAKLVKKYYQACTDEKKREADGIRPIAETIARIGGWPMTMEKDEWADEKYTWQRVDDYYARLTGTHAFFEIYPTYSPRNNTPTLMVWWEGLPAGAYRVIDKSQDDASDEMEPSEEEDSEATDSQEAGSQESAEEEEEEVETDPRGVYAELVREVATAVADYMGHDVDNETLNQDIDDMLSFMQLLHEALEGHLDSSATMTLNELHRWYNHMDPAKGNARVNWIRTVSLLMGDDVDVDIAVNLATKKYFIALREIFELVPSRIIVNYIHWKFVASVLRYTNKQMKDVHETLIKNDPDYDSYPDFLLPSNETVNIECIRDVDMSIAVSHMFIQKYFPEKLMKEAVEMVEFVRQAVKENIQDSKWLDEATRTAVLEKLDRMEKQIGYPSWYGNATAVRNFYKGVTFGRSHFENALAYKRYRITKRAREALNPEKDDDDFVIPLMVNAMYSMYSNKFFITAADFQDPFYASLRPSVVNFGIIGVIIGHEINHGFDSYGRKFGVDGAEIEWVRAMAKAYQDREQCFIDQYNNYTSRENYGELTRNENIADTMGLEAALHGYYARRIALNEEDVRLPGIEKFTTEQLFFLSYANLQCETETKWSQRRRDVHSSGRLRVIGAVSNAESFGESFDCPAGSPMNPVNKCNIWN